MNLFRILLATVALLAISAPAASAARMPTPPNLTIHRDTPCPAYEDGGSCSFNDSADVFLEPGASRFDRWHEVAHQFDRQVLTARDREWFTRHLGYPAGHPWVTGTGEGCGSACPNETFADAYAACALNQNPGGRKRGGMLVGDWTTAYGYYPTIRQHRRVCNGIAVIGLVRVAR